MGKRALLGVAAMGASLIAGTATALAAPEAARLVPPSPGLPAPGPFMEIIQLLTFFMHLIMVNIVLGSVLLAVIDRRTSASDEKGEVSFIPKALALAVNFAIAPFLFLQVLYGSFLYPSIVIMAAWWMSIFLLVMLAYYGLYISDEAARPDKRGLPLALAAVLLLITAFLLTNFSTLMLRPDNWPAWFSNPHGTVLNLEDPTLFPRYLHVILASLAVGGLTMAWRAHWSPRKPETSAPEADRRLRRGLNWFFYASLSQIPVGLLFLFTLPAGVRGLFLGGDILYTASLLLALAGLILALVKARQGSLKLATAMTLGIILLMVCVRSLVRDAMLRPYLEAMPPATENILMPHGQNIAVGFFLVCAIFTAAAIFWLVRVSLNAAYRKDDSGTEEI